MEEPQFNSDTFNFDSINQQNKELASKNQELQTAIASSAYADQQDQNLIQYQLETDKLLERMEHFLRGDIVKFDEDGNVFYEKPEDPELRNFNDYGVAELMRIFSMYVTKETFLSYYTEERINELLADLGDALADFMYCNYEKIGMDTKFKETKFSLIVLNILHTIESCYRRALGGMEQKNIQTRSIVTQNNSMGQPGGMGMLKQGWSPKNIFNPNRW